jgi:hypothetical protein
MQIRDILSKHAALNNIIPKPLSKLNKDSQSARKRASNALKTVWFERFTAVPRMYESTPVSNAILHESRRAVSYMMLCLPSRFKLDAESPAIKAKVHALGVEAETRTLEFLAAHGSQAVAVGSVVKAMRALQMAGHLKPFLTSTESDLCNAILSIRRRRQLSHRSSAWPSSHDRTMNIIKMQYVLVRTAACEAFAL